MSDLANSMQFLSWDSEQFGFSVARILPPRLNATELKPLYAALKEQGVRLAYWASDRADKASQEAAQAFKGFLADEKVTYVASLNISEKSSPVLIEPYLEKKAEPVLYQLAEMAGEYSRFAVDPRISKSLFKKIYHLWMDNSVNGQIADVVLVAREKKGRDILGMATLGEKQSRGDIGLLAVMPEGRGRGIGLSLLAAATDFFKQKSYTETQVVTQHSNIPACRLYEKKGYHIDKIENFYHFWIE